MRTTRRTPKTRRRLITLHVLRRERLSPHFERVTLGEGDIEQFVSMGYDQWFRLFLPVPGGTLDRVPNKLDMVSYLRFLTISKANRPVLRNYSVRAFRPDAPGGPELDVDFVLHGSVDDGTSGPAATWAQTCHAGDPVGLLDEGTGFGLADDVRHLRIVTDETGLPATANIIASLPEGVTGEAVVEIPDDADRQDLGEPEGFEVVWLPRTGSDRPIGELALQTIKEMEQPAEKWFGVALGEQSLASGVRRHWVDHGQPKDELMFCGYWRSAQQH